MLSPGVHSGKVSRGMAGFQPMSPDARAAFMQERNTGHVENRSLEELRLHLHNWGSVKQA